MTFSYADQTVDGKQIRNALFSAVRTLYPMGPGNFQQRVIFSEIKKALQLLSYGDEQAFLNDGLIAPGLNLDNPELPHIHLTPKGREHFSLQAAP